MLITKKNNTFSTQEPWSWDNLGSIGSGLHNTVEKLHTLRQPGKRNGVA